MQQRPLIRALKRVLNALLLTLYLDGHDDATLNSLQNQSDKDRARRLAKLVLLQVCFDETWRTLVTGACSIKDAEKFVLGSDMQLAEETKTVSRRSVGSAVQGRAALFGSDRRRDRAAADLVEDHLDRIGRLVIPEQTSTSGSRLHQVPPTVKNISILPSARQEIDLDEGAARERGDANTGARGQMPGAK